MRLRDSVVVITGASSGIGRATALAFARRGANVVLAARGEEALADVARDCGAEGVETLAVPTDVTDAVAVDQLAQTALARFGRVDIWVNNAAVTVFGPLTEVPLGEIRRVLDVNIMGYVHGARSALPIMRRQGKGLIVDVSSILSKVPQPYTHAYVMSKAAVRALSASLRQELMLAGDRGVRVVTVMPATMDTPLFDHAANHTGRRVKAMPPVYPPERVARAVVRMARLPRRETVVGPAGRVMMWQQAMAPGLMERVSAVQVDRTHLSRRDPAADTSGNLFSAEKGAGATDGGWHGQRRTNVRRLVGATMLGVTAAGLVLRSRRTPR